MSPAGYVISDSRQDQRAGTPAPPGPLRVLIVDDDRDSLLTLGLLCRERGMEVRMLRVGADLEDVVAEFRPHVVLLDLVLPDRSGFDIAGELTLRYGNNRPLLVALTAHTSEADRRMALAAGFHEFIAKPYDPARLMRRLAALTPKSI